MPIKHNNTQDKSNVSPHQVYPEVEAFFDKERILEKKILVAVSGGCDSMLVLRLLNKYFRANKKNLKNITVFHYHHQIRKEADQDEALVREFSKENTYVVASRYGGLITEADLRKRRYVGIESVAKSIGNNVWLFTGHHLDDRIETTLLHLVRGAGLKGILNMKMIGNKANYTICRPLLCTQKYEIMQQVQEYNIPYVIDNTNNDASISQRNALRIAITATAHTTESPIEYRHQLGKSFARLYKSLDEVIESKTIENTYKELIPSPMRGNCEYYVAIDIVSKDVLYSVLRKKGHEYGRYDSMLERIVDFFSSDFQGYIYSRGIYFWKAHGKKYIICAEKGFWKTTNPLKVMPWIDDFPQESAYLYRYPLQGDKVAGKSLKKYLMNRKVPFFRRNSIPIIENNTTIEQILLPKDNQWYW